MMCFHLWKGIQKALDVGVPAELITAARAVNRSMPLHVAQIVTELLWKAGVHADEAKVLFLGWSYKANVGDPRETPALLIFEFLKSKGITVGSWDPHMNYTKFPDEVIPIGSIEDARGYDLAILVTAHKKCLEINWNALAKQMRHSIIFDGRVFLI